MNSAKPGKTEWYISIKLKEGQWSRDLGCRREGVSESRVRGGRGEGRKRGERVELPDSLFPSLVEPARRPRYRLPDGRRLKRLCEGWLGSPTMLVALWVRRDP